eukprot:759790-Hanusia_phi.AAC.4
MQVLEEPPDIKDMSPLLVPSLFCPFQVSPVSLHQPLTIVHAGSSGDSLFFIEHGSGETRRQFPLTSPFSSSQRHQPGPRGHPLGIGGVFRRSDKDEELFELADE